MEKEYLNEIRKRCEAATAKATAKATATAKHMQKHEQLIKELQALIGNTEMNEVIKEKICDAYFLGMDEESKRWVERIDKSSNRLKDGMSEEEKKRMDKAHYFYSGNDEDDEVCVYCGISQFHMDEWPQYCLTKKEKEDAKA